jgi:two-component system, cell cycle sensor histidine kinase and response regulator CckA
MNLSSISPDLEHAGQEACVPEPALEEDPNQRYRELTELLPQSVFEMDLEGRILFANQAFFSAYQLSDEDREAGLDLQDLHVAGDRERMRGNLSKLLAGGRTGHEYTGVRKDGTTFPLVAHVATIQKDGRPAGFRGILVDLSRQKKAEASLRASEERYRAVFENTGNASVIVEGDWTITLANSEWSSLTGVAEGDFRVHVHPDDRDRLEGYHAARLLGDAEVPRSYEFRILDRNGEVRHLINHVGLIPGTDSSFASMTDVTGLKRVEVEREHLQNRLRQSEKLEAIGQLAGGVAHDFNNHLSAILGFAEMLLDREQPADERRYAEKIVTCCRRAADLTRQLLAFARKGNYLSVPVDVNKVIHELVGLLRHSIDRRITLEQVFETPSAFITGDPTQVQNALMNMALNARDAMPEGGRLAFATGVVLLDEDYCRRMPYVLEPGRYVRISVEDTGLGMDAETCKRLFEPFFTTKEVGKGTGLGLASVYGTVKQHGGAINVYSEPGRGSCFKVYLPLLASLDDPDEHAKDRIDTRGTSRILLVDDETLVAEMATGMLQGLGYTVDVCADGQEAVEFYRRSWRAIDLVILDMIMPRLGGVDTFRALLSVNPKARIILSSGFSVEGEAQGLLNQGALAFLQKPYHKSELARALEEALRNLS